MEWPEDLSKHIVGLSLSSDSVRMVQNLKETLLVCGNENKGNLILSDSIKLKEPRTTQLKALPSIFVPVYEMHSPNTTFCHKSGLTFYSEDDHERLNVLSTDNYVDLATTYEGLGNVIVYTYFKQKNKVLSYPDGGENGYAEEDNHIKRLKRIDEIMRLETSPDLEDLEAWWNRVTSSPEQ